MEQAVTLSGENSLSAVLYFSNDRQNFGSVLLVPFKYEAQTALFKDPVRTALLCYVLTL